MVLIKTDTNKITSLKRWTVDSKAFYYAYQPIVNIHTGYTLGFEALLRGWEDAGFDSINDVFSSAYDETVLYSLDLHLRDLAVTTLFSRSDFMNLKLFYNIDNRVLEMPDYNPGNTEKIIKNARMHQSNICFEISEKHEFANYKNTHTILRDYKNQNYRIALDDFGSGYAGLTLLYHSEPDYIKIDRFFIENINDDSRKKFFVSNIVKLAHMMGSSVIAEGVETVGEFYVCREIGCDYVQGYLINRPESRIDRLLPDYPIVGELVNSQSRKTEGDRCLIQKEITNLPAVSENISTEKLLEMFRKDRRLQCFPIVNSINEPLGLLRESDLKKYVYSPYGISILQHKSSTDGIESLIHRAPVMEISNPIEKILELYSLNEDLDNVIITENGRYRGILDSSSILRILSEKKISIARDQNPLTRLPGNTSLNTYLSSVLRGRECPHILVYFDFDNFKPFNDVYGFRQGDRIIRLFADILREHRILRKDFTGHIGGDDFFIGYRLGSHSREEILTEIAGIINKFETNALPFYNEEHRSKGYISAKNRSGKTERFPMLSVSAAVICMTPSEERDSIESLTGTIAKLKQKAKKSPKHIAVLEI